MAEYKELIKNKWVAVAALLFLAFMFSLEFKQFTAKRSIDKQIATLQNQAESLQQKNSDLTGMISYFKSDSYTQKAAREQLNLRKDGESVYSFADQGPNTPQPQDAQPAQSSSVSNTRKWYNYFFNPGK